MAKDITTPVFIILVVIMCTVYAALVSEKEKDTSKPISYPEEIQAVRAGDTLYVSSVSDSIYIGFKQFKNK